MTKIQEFVKSIEGVQGCVWHYDEMLLEVFIKEENWNKQNFILGRIYNHISPNLLANFETIKFVMV